MGQRKQNVNEYAKNKSFVGDGEASTEAHSSRFRKADSKGG